MNYRETLAYLDSFLNYEKTADYRYPTGFSLDRVERLLDRCGNPHRRYRTLHVAGTKAKGSTCAFAASILKAAGFKTGLYTSPHLISFTERFQVDGRPISEEALASAVADIQPFITEELTFFEVTTAVAFVYFAKAQLEVAVVEVGLGGRLDATNVLNPSVTAITPISLDHMPQLGPTLEAIAREKAGIIKPGIPVVVAPQERPAWEAIREAAYVRRAPLHSVEREVHVGKISVSTQGTPCAFRTRASVYPDLHIPLLGRHQVANAATAIRMTELLLKSLRKKLSIQAVREGLAKTQWPGRCQLVMPEDSKVPVLLDGAQNGASAKTLRATVEELFPDRRVVLILGASVEKDLAGIASVLGPWAKELILTQADVPRAESPERIAEAFHSWFPIPHICPAVAEAVDRARTQAGPQDLIIVTGSLFVVGEALQALRSPVVQAH